MMRTAYVALLLVRFTLVDTQSLVQNLAFTDESFTTQNVIGGPLSWDPPADTTNVNLYAAYIATNSAGAGASPVGQVAFGVNSLTVSPFTNSGSYTHILVYTKDASGTQASSGAAVLMTDRSVPFHDVQGLTFTDTDARLGFISGTVVWAQPADITFVSHYAAYVAPASSGLDRTQIGSVMPVGTNQVDVPANTVASTATHIWVYSQNSLGRNDPPAIIAAIDLALPTVTVSSLSFYDTAIDKGKIAGDVTWTPPGDTSLVSSYITYMAGGGNSKQTLGMVPVGINVFVVPTDTSLGTFSEFQVFAFNAMGEANSYSSLAIVDRAVPLVSITGAVFVDVDTDGGEIGGVVYWTPPGDVSTVTHYTVHAAVNELGTGKVKVGPDVPVGTNQLTIQNDTVLYDILEGIRAPQTYLLLYTANAVGEQRIPFALRFTEVGVSFLDDDLHEGLIGGIVRFTPYPNPSALRRIRVYFAEDRQGTGKQEVANDMEYVTLNSNEQRNQVLGLVDAELILGSNYMRHSPAGDIVVGSSNSRVLDARDMTGRVATKRSLQLLPLPVNIIFGRDVSVTASKYSLLNGYELLNFSTVLVTAESPSGTILRQEAGSFVERVAPVEGVSQITFSDHDFERNKIGGVIRWTPPSDISFVVKYRVYLSDHDAGGPAVGDLPMAEIPVGQNEAVIPLGTVHRKYIIVAAWGHDVAQSHPSSAVVSDVALYGCLRKQAEETLNISGYINSVCDA